MSQNFLNLFDVKSVQHVNTDLHEIWNIQWMDLTREFSANNDCVQKFGHSFEYKLIFYSARMHYIDQKWQYRLL